MKGLYYDHLVSIDSRDVDANGYCRPSALLGHLQEAATLAAERGGFGRERLLSQCGSFWMLARMWYELKRPLHWEEQLKVTTWHRGGKGAIMYRDFDLWCGEEHVGQAVSAWVLVDLESRKMLRLKDVPFLEGTDGGALCKSIQLSKLRMPEEMVQRDLRLMRYSDTDINGHVNNTRYADFACDTLNMERLGGDYFLSSMQLGYVAECRAGEHIRMCSAQQEGAHYVKGEDEQGKTRFEVRMTFAVTPEI